MTDDQHPSTVEIPVNQSAPDPVSLEPLVQQAIANGWPAEDVVAVTAEICGPMSPPTTPPPPINDENVGGASDALHRLFAEASSRRQNG